MIKELESKISNKEAKIAIIGLGYVGLPLAIRFVDQGFSVTGIDTDYEKCEMLNNGKSYLSHIDSNLVSNLSKKSFKADLDFSLIKEVDIIIICVPTPLNINKSPDLSFILDSFNSMGPYLQKGQLLSLESTTYPGTTSEEIAPLLQKKGFEIGKDFFLIYSPEREDPGNQNYSIQDIPKVCGGYTDNCLKVGKAIYSKIINKVVTVSSTRAAEMTKLLENIHRSVNIGLVNEMKIIADAMDIDINEVISAAATKPFGFVPYRPGPGLGGHCIPIDPFYLSWKAKKYGIDAKLIELAGEINLQMPEWVVGKIETHLNEKKKTISQSKILILGVAYKKNVGDIRESPSITIIELISSLGGLVSYSDPYVDEINELKDFKEPLKSKRLTKEILKESDCVVLTADHDDFDYDQILEISSLIVDTRGKFPKNEKVKLA